MNCWENAAVEKPDTASIATDLKIRIEAPLLSIFIHLLGLS
ncbi:hypothetical protein PA257_0325 [Pseudomonas aeruginosa]|nr:hypothetical protein PA257_0325 [Pseudomonas aeruginosa]